MLVSVGCWSHRLKSLRWVSHWCGPIIMSPDCPDLSALHVWLPCLPDPPACWTHTRLTCATCFPRVQGPSPKSQDHIQVQEPNLLDWNRGLWSECGAYGWMLTLITTWKIISKSHWTQELHVKNSTNFKKKSIKVWRCATSAESLVLCLLWACDSTHLLVQGSMWRIRRGFDDLVPFHLIPRLVLLLHQILAGLLHLVMRCLVLWNRWWTLSGAWIL